MFSRELPISLKVRGAEVKQLHVNLRAPGFAIPLQTPNEDAFSVATRDAILQFQARYRLSR